MTADEEIIERACDEHRKACHCCQMDWECDWDIRKRVAVLIREDEREKCAKVCESIEIGSWTEYKTGNGPGRASEHTEGISDGAAQCATAIRTRKDA